MRTALALILLTVVAWPPHALAQKPAVPPDVGSLKAKPDADDFTDDDPDLADGFLKTLPNGASAPGGYKVCQDTATHEHYIACGARPCPAGTVVVAWNPGDHPNCSYSDDCVDMKDLGWVGGHKTKFCRARGFDGVKPKGGKYKKERRLVLQG